MPEAMSESEIATFLDDATELDTYDYRNEDDEDDYVSAVLYEAKDRRHFRYVVSTGMDSSFSGAGHFGEWLTAEEEKDWTKF